jgi:putative peptide zinc metalloprotease protein
VAFVDTSDMWLEGKRRRTAVAFAGPYTNFVLAGAAALAGSLVGSSAWAAVLFTLGADGYIVGLLNLNPLYELDGYYMLSDWLEVPNLRSKALAYDGGAVWRRRPFARCAVASDRSERRRRHSCAGRYGPCHTGNRAADLC